MAKGLRASSKKSNKASLRQKVFGPVESARKERLSTKLLELVSRPQSIASQDQKSGEEHQGQSSEVTAAAIVETFTNTFLEPSIEDAANMKVDVETACQGSISLVSR
jgi:hypothetical protein